MTRMHGLRIRDPIVTLERRRSAETRVGARHDERHGKRPSLPPARHLSPFTRLRCPAAGTRRVADRAPLWNGILEEGAFG